MNIDKEKTFQKMKGLVISIGKKGFVILTTILSFSAGFILNYYINIYDITNKISNKHIKTYDDVSTAINESGELIIIDKHSGSYDIYSDTIGLAIFNFYGSKIFYSKK